MWNCKSFSVQKVVIMETQINKTTRKFAVTFDNDTNSGPPY